VSGPENPAPEPTPIARIEPPTPDVEAAASTSVLPGEHRGGFARLPTAPIDVALGLPAQLEPPTQWLVPEPVRPYRGVAGWALAFAVIGLAVSLFVGWGFPIGLVAVVSGIVALRRPLESRAVAVWALAMGSVSVVFSAGWLLWAMSRAQLAG
jgi:hypothetical protein